MHMHRLAIERVQAQHASDADVLIAAHADATARLAAQNVDLTRYCEELRVQIARSEADSAHAADVASQTHTAELARLQDAHLAEVLAAGGPAHTAEAAVLAARNVALELECEQQRTRIERQGALHLSLQANTAQAREQHAVLLRALAIQADEAAQVAARSATEQVARQQLAFDTQMTVLVRENERRGDAQTRMHAQQMQVQQDQNALRMQMQEAAFVRDGVDRLEQDGIIRARRALEISLVRSMLGEMLRQPREPSNVIAGVNLQYCLQLMAQQPNTVPAILTSDFFFTQPGSQHFVTEASQIDEDTLYYSMQHVLEVLLRGAFAARARVRGRAQRDDKLP